MTFLPENLETPPAPECERMVQVAPFSQHVGDFLDWCEEQGLRICRFEDEDDHWWPHLESKTKLLARFYEIDLDKVETERRVILESLQS